MTATLDLSPTIVNLKVARGDTWPVRFTFYAANPDGTPDLEQPVDLSGASYACQFRVRSTGELFATADVDTTDAAEGTLVVMVDAADTEAAPLGKSLAYDLQQTTGSNVATLVSGSVRVVADWTQEG